MSLRRERPRAAGNQVHSRRLINRGTYSALLRGQVFALVGGLPSSLDITEDRRYKIHKMDANELEITAQLAYLELTEAEKANLGRAVDQVLEYFGKMKEVDVENLAPTTHALLTRNRLRRDEVARFADPAELLERAPELEDRFIVIPNVL